LKPTVSCNDELSQLKALLWVKILKLDINWL